MMPTRTLYVVIRPPVCRVPRCQIESARGLTQIKSSSSFAHSSRHTQTSNFSAVQQHASATRISSRYTCHACAKGASLVRVSCCPGCVRVACYHHHHHPGWVLLSDSACGIDDLGQLANQRTPFQETLKLVRVLNEDDNLYLPGHLCIHSPWCFGGSTHEANRGLK